MLPNFEGKSSIQPLHEQTTDLISRWRKISDEAEGVDFTALPHMGTNPPLRWNVRLLASINLHLFLAPFEGNLKFFIFSLPSFLGQSQFFCFSSWQLLKFKNEFLVRGYVLDWIYSFLILLEIDLWILWYFEEFGVCTLQFYVVNFV